MRKINPITPSTIVSQRFIIPLYQRLFEWEDEQLSVLLNDLKERFFITRRSINERNKAYYIGMLTGCTDDSGIINLVDGQQRFTTMMLLGIAMNYYYEDWKYFVTQDRLTFKARDDDKKYLQYLIDFHVKKEKDNTMPTKINLKMQHGLDFILNFLTEKFKEDEREEFCKYVYNNLTFFVSELPGNYGKSPKKLNKYFETMNSAGKSLEQHEKIKVDLLKNCIDNDLKGMFTYIWNSVERMDVKLLSDEQYSAELGCSDNEIENIFENPDTFEVKKCFEDNHGIEIEYIMPSTDKPNIYGNKKEIGSVIDFQELLLLTYNIITNSNIILDKHKLAETFRNFPIEKIPQFYRKLYLLRLLLDRYVIRVEKKDGKNIYRLRLSDNDKPLSEDEKRLIQYQSMLYVSSSNQQWLKSYLEWLMNSENRKSDATVLLNKLKEIDNNIHKLPPLDEMAYNKGIDRYWFWRLDYYLWEKRELYFTIEEQKVVNDYVFRMNRSIEHLHPQNQSENTEWENIDINSFGNLAMISSSFNSTQSNDYVGVKFARVEKQVNNNDLESLKMYLMYLQSKKEGWTLYKKNNHQIEMYKLLEDSYK